MLNDEQIKDITWTRKDVRLEIESADCRASIMVSVSTPSMVFANSKHNSLIAKTVVEACEDFVYSLSTENISEAYHARSDLQYSFSHELGEELADSFELSCEENGITVMLNGLKVVDFCLNNQPRFEISEATIVDF
jgi:hypothetical protein